MEVSGQPTAPTTLYILSTNLEVGWAHSGSGRFGDGKKCLALPQKNTPVHAARSSFEAISHPQKHQSTGATINCLKSLKISWQQKEVESLQVTSLFSYEHKSIDIVHSPTNALFTKPGKVYTKYRSYIYRSTTTISMLPHHQITYNEVILPSVLI
jgi:hypothetical protein